MEQATRLETQSQPDISTPIRGEESVAELEIIEEWGRTNGGTIDDIRMQVPELKGKTRKEVSEMCETLAAKGRLPVTRVPAPSGRYLGRSLKKSTR